MNDIPHETGNFCHLIHQPMALFAIAIWIHLTVAAYCSQSIDEFLKIMLSPFSKKGFIISWVAISITIPALLIIYSIRLLCN